jgi:hypothetical protein
MWRNILYGSLRSDNNQLADDTTSFHSIPMTGPDYYKTTLTSTNIRSPNTVHEAVQRRQHHRVSSVEEMMPPMTTVANGR